MLQKETEQQLSDMPYMTEKVIFARQMTKFINLSKGIRKVIVNEWGDILGFPGIEHLEIVRQMLHEGSTSPVVRYRTEFRRQTDGTHMMIWEIQPEGRYWADEDGFGGESDSEIRLYSFLDENGEFTAPFRIYNVDNTKYFGTNLEEQMVEAQKHREQMGSFEESMDEILSLAAKTILKQLRAGSSKCQVRFEIARTRNTGHLILKLESENKFFVTLQVARDGLNRSYIDFLKKGTAEEVTRYLKSKSSQKGIKQAVLRLSNLVDRDYI